MFKPKFGKQKIKDQNRKLNTTQNENHIVLPWLVSLKVLGYAVVFFQIWEHAVATLTLRLRTTHTKKAESSVFVDLFIISETVFRSPLFLKFSY